MMTIRKTCLASTAIGVLFVASPGTAQEVRKGATISVGGSYATNPFLNDGDNNGAASVFVEVAPVLTVTDEKSQLTLDGAVRYHYYPSRYGSDPSGRLGIRGQRRMSERFTLTGGAAAQTSRSAALDNLLNAPSVLTPEGTIPELPVYDLTVAGQRTRTTSVSAFAGGDYVLSPVDSLSGQVSARKTFYSGDVGTNYGEASVALSYGRRISETMTATAGVSFAKIDYADRVIGDAIIYGANAGIDWSLSETAKARARIGVSRARIDQGASGSRNSTFLTGLLGYCDRTLGGSVCVSASRSARPTGFNGVTAVSSLSLGYSRELNDISNLSASVRYARTDGNDDNGFGLPDWNSELLGVTATYSRRLNDRLRAFVSPSATKVTSSTFDRKPNFGIQAGVSLQIGDVN